MNDLGGPLVSVVMPTYNHARYLGRALQSVLNQTYTNWEAIVIDNHSTDNTDEVMTIFADSRITYLKIHNNGVIAASRNAGIRAAKGVWIAFLDSDDWWTADKLMISLEVAHVEKADLIYHDLFCVTHETQKIYFRKAKGKMLDKPIFVHLLKHGNVIPNSSVLVKKSILEKVGRLSEVPDKISWEDYDCWLRISKISDQFVYVSKPLGYYWIGGGNYTNPRRTILNCIAITKHYTNVYCQDTPFWLSYSHAMALIKCGLYNSAKDVLYKTDFKDASLLEVIKCKLRYWHASVK